MVTHPGAGGVRPFLKLVEVQALRGAADRDLLRRFAAARDEAAFRVIAERHGPMVFGVCARLLGNRHDAEDALQATFLVFARRAACVRNSESLASWLHGVARRVATRLRRADHRRAARERAAATPEPRPPDDPAWSEVRAGLDEELARLPEAYREVLVLCYLEGLTRDEAGQRLGIDAGAVKGRLERGRRLLGERLTRRGIGLSAALAGLATAPPLTAAVRVGRLAADPTAASPRAAALTHDFLKGVAMSKIKLVTAGLAGVLVLAVGVGSAQQSVVPLAVPASKAAPAQLGGTKTYTGPDKDTDEAFIRRVSKDLRGTDPTPAEVHFFLASKDATKRATLVDLFVKERADKGTARAAETEVEKHTVADLILQQKRAIEARDAEARAALERRRAQEELARAKAAADDPLALALAARRRAEVEHQRAEAEAAEARAAEARARATTERERALAEVLTRKAQAERAAVDEKVREAAEAIQRDAAKQKLKGSREPADPAARPVPPKAPAAPAVPPPLPPQPKVPPAVVLPPAIAPAAPAANVEALRVRVQLAELTVREKQLAVREAEEQTKTGAVPRTALERARLELERAQLQLREAALILEAGERAAPRPGADPRAAPPSRQ